MRFRDFLFGRTGVQAGVGRKRKGWERRGRKFEKRRLTTSRLELLRFRGGRKRELALGKLLSTVTDMTKMGPYWIGSWIYVCNLLRHPRINVQIIRTDTCMPIGVGE